MTTITATRTKLLACYDLRAIDPVTGTKEPLAEGEGCTCDRCGKIHAVVYQVAQFREGSRHPVPGTIQEVGSTCFRKMFDRTPAAMGWGGTMNQFAGKDARAMLARTRA